MNVYQKQSSFCAVSVMSAVGKTPLWISKPWTVSSKSFHVEIARSAIVMGDWFLSGKAEEKKLGEIVS